MGCIIELEALLFHTEKHLTEEILAVCAQKRKLQWFPFSISTIQSPFSETSDVN